MLALVAGLVLAYLLGSVPVGYLVVKIFKRVDVTKVGSGRIGGSNVLRAAGVPAAVITILGDAAKGYGGAALAALAAPQVPVAPVLGALAAVAGHNWSIFLGFDGGVGTATTFGGALALAPLPAGVSLAAGVAAVAIWRHTSLGSLTFAGVLTLATIISAVSGVLPAECILFSAGTTLMAVWELRPNIERLRQGTERKINQYIPKGGRDVISQGERR